MSLMIRLEIHYDLCSLTVNKRRMLRALIESPPWVIVWMVYMMASMLKIFSIIATLSRFDKLSKWVFKKMIARLCSHVQAQQAQPPFDPMGHLSAVIHILNQMIADIWHFNKAAAISQPNAISLDECVSVKFASLAEIVTDNFDFIKLHSHKLWCTIENSKIMTKKIAFGNLASCALL